MNFSTRCAVFAILGLGIGQPVLSNLAYSAYSAYSDRCADVEQKLKSLQIEKTVLSDSQYYPELKMEGIKDCASAVTLTVCKSNQFRCSRRFISMDGPLGAWVFFTSGTGNYQLEFTVVPVSGTKPIKVPFAVENIDSRPASDLPFLLPEPLIESHRIEFNSHPPSIEPQAIAKWIKTWIPKHFRAASLTNGQSRSALQVLDTIGTGSLFRPILFSDIEVSRLIVAVLRHFSIPSRFVLGIKRDLQRSAAWVEFKAPHILDSQWFIFDPEDMDELKSQGDPKYNARSYYSKYQYDFTPIQRPVVEIME